MTTYANETDDPDVLGGAQEQILLRGARWRRFAVLGDSIAAGVGDVVDGYSTLHWAARVARALRRRQPELAYLNLGERDLRVRAVRETQLEPALAFAPDLAAVVAGGNDAFARTWRPEVVEEELDRVVGALREAGADVFLFGLFDATEAIELPEPWGSRWLERMSDLHVVTEAVAERHGALLVDCTPHPRGADPSIWSADRMHLNMRGHAIAASEVVRELARALRLRPRVSFENSPEARSRLTVG
jgi:lysophospholipase L1-like esterase